MTKEELLRTRNEVVVQMRGMFEWSETNPDEAVGIKDSYDEEKYKALNEQKEKHEAKLEAIDKVEAKLPAIDKESNVVKMADRLNISTDHAANITLQNRLVMENILTNKPVDAAAREAVAGFPSGYLSGLSENIQFQNNISRADNGVLFTDELSPEIVVKDAYVSSIADVCRRIPRSTGDQLKIDTVDLADDQGDVFAKPAGEGKYELQEPSFGQTIIDFDWFTSKRINLDWATMQDSPTPVRDTIIMAVRNRLRRTLMNTSTNGSAGIPGTLTANNKGFTEDVSLTQAAPTGSTTTISWEIIRAAIGMLDPLYAENAMVFMNNNCLLYTSPSPRD